MHQALQLPEILRNIFGRIQPYFDHFLMDSYNTEHRKDLLCCALVCKTFSEPALDALWAYMESIRPCFALFPTFDAETGSLQGKLNPEDIQKFDRHALRIRSLRISTTSQIIPTPSYLRLMKECDRLYIFERLQVLWVEADIPDLTFLMGPQIIFCDAYQFQRLAQADHHPMPTFQKILQSFEPAHRLRFLRLDFRAAQPFHPSCWHGIIGLQNLESLRVVLRDKATSLIQFSTLVKIIALPSLSSFDFHLIDVTDVPPPHFPALKSAHKTSNIESFKLTQCSTAAPSINALVSLLLVFKFPHIEDIEVSAIYANGADLPTESQYWRNLFPTLRASASKSLRELKVLNGNDKSCDRTLSLWHPLQLPLEDVLDDHFSPQIFTIESPFFSPFSHKDFKGLADKWSNLKKLDLLSPSTAGFGLLITVARRLPHLESLGISLDARRLPDENKVPALRHPLYEVHFCRSRAPSDPETFALLLFKLFSNIFEVDFMCCGGGVNQKKDYRSWCKVNHTLDICYSATELNRARLTSKSSTSDSSSESSTSDSSSESSASDSS